MTTADKLALSFLRQMSIEIHKGQDSILVRSFVDNFDRGKISRSFDLFFGASSQEPSSHPLTPPAVFLARLVRQRSPLSAHRL